MRKNKTNVLVDTFQTRFRVDEYYKIKNLKLTYMDRSLDVVDLEIIF